MSVKVVLPSFAPSSASQTVAIGVPWSRSWKQAPGSRVAVRIDLVDDQTAGCVGHRLILDQDAAGAAVRDRRVLVRRELIARRRGDLLDHVVARPRDPQAE